MPKSPSILCIFFLLIFGELQAQTVTFSVVDAQTKEAIPFTTIRGNHFSWETNMNGMTTIPVSRINHDTLCFFFSGYQTYCIHTDSILNTKTPILVSLVPEIIGTGNVQISLGINPAHKWIKLAIEKREANNPAQYPNHSRLVHTRMLVGLQEIKAPLFSQNLKNALNNLSDTFNLLNDSSQLQFVPVFHSQTISKVFHQEKPYREQEVILGSRVDGVGVDQGDFISQLTGTALFTYNVYKPILTFLEKGIPSPIASSSFSTYDFELIHVKKEHVLREFVVKLTPKHASDVAFSGLIWIQEKTGIITRLILELKGTANINYIESLKIIQDFEAGDITGLPQRLKEGKIAIELENVENQAARIIGFNETKVLNIQLEPHVSDSFSFNRIRKSNTSKDSLRSLFDAEDNATYDSILATINAVKEIPQIKRGVRLVNILVDGYYGGNLPIEFGPYYLLGSYNPLEGIRTRLGIRTSWRLSQKWQTEGFLGYGYRDKRFKYGLKFSWHPDFDRGTYVKLSHSQDVELIGFSDNDAVSSGDALNTALNMLASPSVSYCQSDKIEVGTDLYQGLSVSAILSHRQYSLPETQRVQLAWYDSLPSYHLGNNLNNATATIQLRYEPRVFYLNRRNRRKTMSPAGPIYTLYYMQGIPGILGSNYRYHRIVAQMEQRIVWGTPGKTNLKIRGSQVFGTIPFPLLDMPLGNQTPVLNNRAFNQMQLFEFVSDRTIQAQIEHHFNGYFFNRIPFMSKLKWREVLHAKAIYGTLRAENRSMIPQDLSGKTRKHIISDYGDTPYVEAGVGIANMFRFFRVDAIWRITHRDAFKRRNFGVLASAFLKF